MKLFLSSQFNLVADKLSQLISDPYGLRVAFIPTASDIYESHPWLDEDKAKLVEMGFEVFDYDLKNKTSETLLKELSATDVIFVAGGNTFYLLQEARKSGFDQVVKDLISQDKVYIGSSAGSVLLGPTLEPIKLLDDPGESPELDSYESLGVIETVLLPHYGKEKYMDRYERIISEWSHKVKLVTLTDDQVMIVDGERAEII
jgi:dipeptidase E